MDEHLHYGREFLARLVALFLTMAETAEAAALYSLQHRRHVLTVLRKAEIIGMEISAREELLDPAYFDTDFTAWDQSFDPEDAAVLAVSLRSIAVGFAYLVQSMQAASPGNNPKADHVRPHAALLVILISAHAVPVREIPLIDTS